jgi:hypothetical protein
MRKEDVHMIRHIARGLAVAAMLVIPASGLAAAAPTSSLTSELARSNAALGRAAALIAATDETKPTIQANAPAMARKRQGALTQLAASRRAFGRAKAQAVRSLRSAKTRPARTAAATALGTVAAAQADSIPGVLALLPAATGAAERGLANASLDLTIGRDQAIAILDGLLRAGVSASVAPDLLDQLSRLATDRAQEITNLINGLSSSAVSLETKSILARALDADLAGQALSALRLKDLAAFTGLPPEAQQALDGALAAIPGALQNAAGTISGALGLLPPGLRGFVQPIIDHALSAAQILLGTAPAAATPTAPTVPSVPGVTPTPPSEPAAPAVPTIPSLPSLGSLLGGFPLPVDPRNLLNLLPGLASPCNLTGFLPSILPFNPLGLLSGLFGSVGSACPAASAPAAP